MVEYTLMDKLSEDLVDKDVRITGVCKLLDYNNGGLIFSAKYKGEIQLENKGKIIIKASKHILDGLTELYKLLLDVRLLQASGEINQSVNVYGKLKKKRDSYLVKVDEVQYLGLYSAFNPDLLDQIIDLEQMVENFTPKRK